MDGVEGSWKDNAEVIEPDHRVGWCDSKVSLILSIYRTTLRMDFLRAIFAHGIKQLMREMSAVIVTLYRRRFEWIVAFSDR